MRIAAVCVRALRPLSLPFSPIGRLQQACMHGRENIPHRAFATMDLSSLSHEQAIEALRNLMSTCPDATRTAVASASSSSASSTTATSTASSSSATAQGTHGGATQQWSPGTPSAMDDAAGEGGDSPAPDDRGKKRPRPDLALPPARATLSLPHWSLGPHPAAALAHEPAARCPPSARGFDMRKFRVRHVALQVAYVGGSYWGFASQEPGGGEVGGSHNSAGERIRIADLDPAAAPPTVESILFAALRRTCLIEDRDGCGYTRCGRTDRGVSAAGQVLSIRLRSKAGRWDVKGVAKGSEAWAGSSALQDCGAYPQGSEAPCIPSTCPSPSPPSWSRTDDLPNTGAPFPGELEETDYLLALNSVLPTDIRVLSWTDVPDDFSARFSATTRSYRYYIPRRQLDIPSMRAAGLLMCGRHDYRNLCKIDIENTQNWVRDVFSVRVIRDGGVGHAAVGEGMTGAQVRTALSCTTGRPPYLGTPASPRLQHPLFSPEWRLAVSEQDAALDASSPACPTDLYCIEVVGTAFLWHQVRCMVAILMLVGRGVEGLDTVRALLDIEKMPSRPNYKMAQELPLQLYHCGFGDEQWLVDGGQIISPGQAEGEDGEGEVVLRSNTAMPQRPTDDPTRPVRFLRAYPSLYTSLRASPYGLRKATLDLEKVWAGHAVQAAHVRGVLDRLHATRADKRALYKMVGAKAEEGESMEGDIVWGDALQRFGPILAPLSDCEFPLPTYAAGGAGLKTKGTYIPLLTRDRAKAPEEIWAALSEGERADITARHRVNASALDARVKDAGVKGVKGTGRRAADDIPRG